MHRTNAARLLAGVGCAVLMAQGGLVQLQPASANTAAISLSPGSGPIGSSVAVSGSGFQGRVAGTVTFRGSTVASFTTSSRGAVSAAFAVPTGPGGSSTVAVRASRISATASYTVQVATATTSTTSPPATVPLTTVPPTTVPPTTVPPTGVPPTTVPTTTPTPPTGPLGPGHVVATPGPTDPAALYVMVTWDRNDPKATAYDVLRDGVFIGRTVVSGDAWSALSLKDTAVQPSQWYGYQVRASYADGTASALSATARAFVRSNANVGGGRIFPVDAQSGSTDLAKAQAAVNAAQADGGGVVAFGARTYVLGGTLSITGDNVVLRGAGTATTFLQPGFAGGTGEPCSSADPTPMIQFSGTLTTLASVRLTRPIAAGDRTVGVTSTSGLAVGQVVVFDQMNPQSEPSYFQARGIAQDPGTGNDQRYPWDANEIVAVDAATASVTFRYPFSQPFTTAVAWRWMAAGISNGIERMTVQGRGATESTYQRLVDVNYQAHFSVADAQGRWANQNYFRIHGYDVNLVNFSGPDAGVNAAPEACRYLINVYRASNVSFIGGTMGDGLTRNNGGYLTFQFTQRDLVRSSRFYGAQRYALNEHGGGSRDLIFENNYFSATSDISGGADAAAVWLGNTTWGFGGQTIVRNNTFENNYRDVIMWDNPYGVRILDNQSRNCADVCVLYNGWGGSYGGYSPIPDSSQWGSAKLTIARNRFENASVGLHLGYTYSSFYPYLGIKDVIIQDNYITATAGAIKMYGDSTATQRFQVSGNSGTNSYTRPAFVPGDYWSGNVDGVSYGLPVAVGWSAPSFAWTNPDATPPPPPPPPTTTTTTVAPTTTTTTTTSPPTTSTTVAPTTTTTTVGSCPCMRYDFEDGTAQGWIKAWGAAAVANTGLAYTGARGLGVNLSPSGPDWPAVQLSSPPGLTVGKQVTYWVYQPAGAVLTSAQPYVADLSWNDVFAPAVPLSTGWNKVTWTVPSVNAIKAIGLVFNNDAGWTGQMVLDSVRW